MSHLIPVYAGPNQGFIGTDDPGQGPPGVPVAYIIGYRGATRIQSFHHTVTGSPSVIVGANPSRRTVTLKNEGSNDVFIGGEDVNTSNGYRLGTTDAITLEVSGEVWAVTAGTSEAVYGFTEVDA